MRRSAYGDHIRDLTRRCRVLDTRGTHTGRPTYQPAERADLRRVFGGRDGCHCPAGAPAAPLVTTREDGLVCTGCGLVVAAQLLVLDDRRVRGDDDPDNGSRVAHISLFDDAPVTWTSSPAYDRNVHWNEFLSLLTDRNPPVPDGEDAIHAPHRDFSVLEDAFVAWARSRGLERIDALILPPAAVKCLTGVLGVRKAHKYRERWWHILRRLCCAEWMPERFERMGGRRCLPGDLVYRLKQRFRMFAAAFAELRQRRPFYERRKNVPSLPLVFSHLLYQDIGDRWREYAFFINQLKSQQCRMRNELLIAGVIHHLARSGVSYGTDGCPYTWRYQCLLPMDDLREFGVDRQRFLARVRRHLVPAQRRARAPKS